MQIKQLHLVTLLFLVLFFLFPAEIKAQNIFTGDIIITEIMPDPKTVSDSDGEWFEIYNTSNHDINLIDCEFKDNGTNSFTIDNDLIIPNKNYLVLGKNKNQNTNGGVKIDFQYDSFTLANTDDEIIITCDNQEINRVEYNKDNDWQINAGKSMMLTNLGSDNNSATNWCLSSLVYGKGDKGTPGEDNGDCSDDNNNNINPPKLDPNNKPPYPEIIFPQQGYTGQTLTFDGSNSYDPDGDKINYTWEFGDGDIIRKKITTHIYKTPGVYQIKLTVSDGINNRTGYQTIFIYNDQTSELKNKIIINELFANPEGDDEEEWIELKNISQDNIDLKNLIIRDKRTSYQIITSEKLKPNDFFIILKYDSHISLNNTTPETVSLLTPSQQLIDSVSYKENVKTNFSYARLKNDWQWTNIPTAGKENKTSSDNPIKKQNSITKTNKTKPTEKNICPENFQAKIIINELWPAPDGDDTSLEFIELKNLDDQDVNICNWIIHDKNHKYKIPDQKIPADGFLIINRSDSHISLNNSGDIISLLNPKEEIIDSVSYTQTKNNLSWARNNNNNWQWTTTITPHEENIITTHATNSKSNNKKYSKNNFLSVNLAKIPDLDSGQKIITSGIITAKPGVLGQQIMYIENNNYGLQIYNYKKSWPDLKNYDFIKVKGELSYPYGQPRLKIKTSNDIQKLNKKKKINSLNLSINKLSENYLGNLITVAGEIVEKNKYHLYIEDESDELEIVIKPSTSIKLDNLSEGDIIKITGILNKGRNDWQLLPRDNNDIVKIKIKGWEIKNKQNQPEEKRIDNQKFVFITNYIYITLIGIIFALLGLIYKLKIKKYGREKSKRST